MKTFKRKIYNRIRGQLRSFENSVYGKYISLYADYKKISPPRLNETFVKNLLNDNSSFIRLLELNTNSITDSEKILNSKFRVFRFTIEYQKDPDFWHKDFFSGFVYPKIPYPKIKFEENKGRDYIVPWEISRLQFIPTLIQAHRKTGNEKILNFFISAIDDWIKKNPYLIGVNWKCPMDSGIRGINFGIGLIYFYNWLPEEKKTYYVKVLWAHLEYLINNESYKQKILNKHNHYLVSTVSLIFLSLCFSGDKPKEYLQKVITDLKKEILNQFRNDGANFESANHYHQFTLEAILLAEIFLNSYNSNDKKLSLFSDLKVKQRIEKAFKFLSAYTFTNLQSPQFGDSSDGRIIFFKDYFSWNPLDHNFIFNLSNLVLPSFKNENKNFNELYKDSGFGFYRNAKYGISLNSSVITAKRSGHNHLDKGSFVLQILGNPFFIDSGTSFYTSDFSKRNEYRLTRSHNTIILDKMEQAIFRNKGAFASISKINSVIEKLNDTPVYKLIHDGYKRLNSIKEIERVFKCYEDKIEMEEIINGEGNHLVEIIFNVHPDISFKSQNQSIVFTKDNIPFCKFEIDKNISISMEDSLYSPSYREEIQNKKIILYQEAVLPVKYTNTLYITSN